MKDKEISIAIIGLGYVGLTLSVALADRGVKVYGIEKRQEVVDLTNEGIPHFSEIGLDIILKKAVSNNNFRAYSSMAEIPSVDFYIITVGTPLDPTTHLPRLDMIQSATTEVAKHFKAGATVILRSTVQIRTTRDIVKPILDEENIDYNLAMCPERTLEGNALNELSSLPQIIGGINEESSKKAQDIFSILTKTTVVVENPETAEMIKLIDNTSRDVKFAFANEVARACVALGINAYDVINCGKLAYSRTNVSLPGLVGGPCLEKDPHILMHSLKSTGLSLEITKASRLVNERQPEETVNTIFEIAKQKNLEEKDLKVAVLGMAFKGRPETDDLRGSMSVKIVDEIKKRNISELRIFDPVIGLNFPSEYSKDVLVVEKFEDAIDDVDVLVIANNHPFFSKQSIEVYKNHLSVNGFVYDYWNNLEARFGKDDFYYTVGCVDF